jgi:hypothetical protein
MNRETGKSRSELPAYVVHMAISRQSWSERRLNSCIGYCLVAWVGAGDGVGRERVVARHLLSDGENRSTALWWWSCWSLLHSSWSAVEIAPR